MSEYKSISISILIYGQVLLLAYLIQNDVFLSLLYGFLFGLPFAFLCHALLQTQISPYTRMSIIMTATGGFGMLVMCLFESGPLGLYGLINMCQSISTKSSFISLEWIQQRVLLTPWTYTGMLLGCNLGMLYSVLPNCLGKNASRFFFYLSCNLSMFIFMFLFEHISMKFISANISINAPFFMLGMMLLGMFLGALLILWLTEKFIEIYNTFTFSTKYQHHN